MLPFSAAPATRNHPPRKNFVPWESQKSDRRRYQAGVQKTLYWCGQHCSEGREVDCEAQKITVPSTEPWRIYPALQPGTCGVCLGCDHCYFVVILFCCIARQASPKTNYNRRQSDGQRAHRQINERPELVLRSIDLLKPIQQNEGGRTRAYTRAVVISEPPRPRL